MFGLQKRLCAGLLLGAVLGGTNATLAEGTWRGLVVAPEHRCAPYDSRDYRYPASVEDRIVAGLGGVFSPYTGRCFANTADTGIDTSLHDPRRTTAAFVLLMLRRAGNSRPTCST